MTDLKRFLIVNWYPNKITDSDLARALEIDASLLSKWLNGSLEPPIERKIQVAKILGVDSRLIFSDQSELVEYD
ncbi:MAG: helix-turn-helix domain-containing protein [Candidatus Omnitrophica bacterium]|nr:helix-turn-helix domain-containing protein [Candidatus Omnitrophota bacterium]